MADVFNDAIHYKLKAYLLYLSVRLIGVCTFVCDVINDRVLAEGDA